MTAPIHTIYVKRLPHSLNLPLPQRMTEGSSGCDVYAAVNDSLELKPHQWAAVPTGLTMEIPFGMEIQVRPRSGLALKHGVTVLNAPGTIDADYRGEVCVILINHSDKPCTIHRGDRIAQLVTQTIPQKLMFQEVDCLNATHRDSGGFGHTGK